MFDAEGGQPPRLLDAQVGDALANRVADFRRGQKIDEELLHAAHQPGALEDRLVQFTGHGVATAVVLDGSLGKAVVAVASGDVGPGERAYVVGA